VPDPKAKDGMRKVSVTVGLANGSNTEVTSGLKKATGGLAAVIRGEDDDDHDGNAGGSAHAATWQSLPWTRSDRTFDKTLSVNGAVQLEVSTGSGYVHVTPGSDNQVHIVGHVRANHGWWVETVTIRSSRLSTIHRSSKREYDTRGPDA